MRDELRNLISIVVQYDHLSFAVLMTTMVVAIGCGILIYLVYRFFYRGVIYSENFGVLIVLVTGATSFIIVTVGANLVLSLGMVGALSIVRFRTAIKEPLDIGFLFIGISAGLAAGARLYLVALIGTISLLLVYVLLSYIRVEKKNFLLILRYADSEESNVSKLTKNLKHKLKNKTFSNGEVELTIEVYVKRNDTEFMSDFTSAEFISSAVLVEYNGDYT